MLLTTWQAIAREFLAAQTLWLALLFILAYPLVGQQTRAGRKQHGWSLNLALIAHLLLVPLSASLALYGDPEMARLTAFGYRLTGLFILITVLTRLIYSFLLPRFFGLQVPQIAHDLSISTLTIFAFFVLAAQAGLNLMGVIATSAVVTAVIGLSLQDTLGNLMGGLMLQMDKSLRVGDWVRIGEVSGRVSEIAWRYTAIETRNWETVYVPNSQLMKGNVMVLGRRLDPVLRWRRWIWFQTDFRYAPSEVSQIVLQALNSADIPNVADDPPIQCLLMEFTDSSLRFAVRYWLLDPGIDDPTDSAVRTLISYALKRAGIPMSLPSQAVYLNQGDPGARGQVSSSTLAGRIQFLSSLPLLQSLNQNEIAELSEKLLSAPFYAGEVITRQGAQGNWLYILTQGQVSVRVRGNAGEDVEIAQIEAVNIFGEMSLMTGEPRSSTIVALTDVHCFRLDKESFQEILQHRPQIAEYIAETLAERKAHTAEVSSGLSERAAVEAEKLSLLANIRAFFKLGD